MPRVKKVKVVEEPIVEELADDSIMAKKIEKKRIFQEKKQTRLNTLVEQKALELIQQKEKDEEPYVEEEVIVVKKNRKPKQKKVVYIEEDEEIEDYVYKQTKPNIPIQIRYW